MTLKKWLVILPVVLVAGAGCAGQAGLLQGSAPTDLGVHGGRLKAPSKTDNSVTSQAALWPDAPERANAEIAPLALRGDGTETIAKIKALVERDPAATIVTSRPDYLYAQYTSRFFKFVDDTEFWYDPSADVVQVRSASRVGQSDLGVNRKRIEAIRKELASQG